MYTRTQGTQCDKRGRELCADLVGRYMFLAILVSLLKRRQQKSLKRLVETRKNETVNYRVGKSDAMEPVILNKEKNGSQLSLRSNRPSVRERKERFFLIANYENSRIARN